MGRGQKARHAQGDDEGDDVEAQGEQNRGPAQTQPGAEGPMSGEGAHRFLPLRSGMVATDGRVTIPTLSAPAFLIWSMTDMTRP